MTWAAKEDGDSNTVGKIHTELAQGHFRQILMSQIINCMYSKYLEVGQLQVKWVIEP